MNLPQRLALTLLVLILTSCRASPSIPSFPDLPVIPLQVPDNRELSIFPTDPPQEANDSLSKPTYILLMGTDRTTEYGSWRTDSLILTMFSSDKTEITLISLPRDWYVQVAGYGNMRINQVDFIGERQEEGLGPQLLNSVFERYMGLEVDHWVRFHMNGFHEVFRKLEPIEVVLSCPFYETIWDARTGATEWYHIPAGEVQMDAHTAFLYVRLRGFSSDFGRLARQRNLLWAVRNQINRQSFPDLFPVMMKVLDQNFETDMSLQELLHWAQMALSIEPHKIKGLSVDRRFVVDELTPGGASVQRLRSEEFLYDVIERKEEFSQPLGRIGTQTCRLPRMSDNAFQRISQLNNLVPSLLLPGTHVSLISMSNLPIALYNEPGLNGKVIGRYETGTQLTVVQHSAYLDHPVPATDHRWYYVETPDQIRGWVSDRYLRLSSQ